MTSLAHRIDIRAFARELTTRHNERGGAALCLDKGFTDAFFACSCGAELTNVTPDADLFKVVGPRLSPKDIRRWLWNHREDERLGDYTSVVWTVYDPPSRQTHVGLAKIVVPQPEPKIASPSPS